MYRLGGRYIVNFSDGCVPSLRDGGTTDRLSCQLIAND